MALESFRRGRLREQDFPNTEYCARARARTTVILAGKCGSRRQSTTSFGENILVAKTSYQMLEILSFSDRKRALPLYLSLPGANFCGCDDRFYPSKHKSGK